MLKIKAQRCKETIFKRKLNPKDQTSHLTKTNQYL